MKTLATFLALSAANGLAICHANEDLVDFAANGKKIQVSMKSIPALESGFSVVYSVEDKDTRLNSRSPLDAAQVSTVTYGEKDSPYQLTIILKRLENLRAFTVQGIFHNRSGKNLNLKTFNLLDTSKGAGGSFAVENAADWLVTPKSRRSEPRPNGLRLSSPMPERRTAASPSTAPSLSKQKAPKTVRSPQSSPWGTTSGALI
jgi:hypothetical protein